MRAGQGDPAEGVGTIHPWASACIFLLPLALPVASSLSTSCSPTAESDYGLNAACLLLHNLSCLHKDLNYKRK